LTEPLTVAAILVSLFVYVFLIAPIENVAVRAAILLAIILLVLLLFLPKVIPGAFVSLQKLAPEPSFWPTTLQTWAEIIWRVFTVLGIMVGGLFAYYKFWKGREFARRVEPKLSAGSVARSDGRFYLQAEASAKNIGLSRVEISHEYTYILVEVREFGTADWVERDDLYFVFQPQQALEPGETVGEPVLIEIPDNGYLAVRLTLGFAASHDNQWWARSLVNLVGEADNG